VWDVDVNQLDDEELSIGYFQQDRATSHTSYASMAEIQSFFRRPRHFEGTLATSLARSDAASLFMRISERESLPNNPRTIDVIKANFPNEILAVTADNNKIRFNEHKSKVMLITRREKEEKKL